MRKLNKFIFLMIILFSLTSCLNAKDNRAYLKVKWKLSTKANQWQDMPDIKIKKIGKANISINLKSINQEIDGFGGSFNEKGWIALSILNSEKIEEVMKSLFDQKDGAKFNICRIPIGASDYAISRYTLNENKNDFKMEKFSIERDRQYLIPFIKAAMKYKPDLKMWASAWTPPTWMKTNNSFDSGFMMDDPVVYDAYALYLMKFINAYKAEDIDMFCVAVQNEPAISTKYPSCLWDSKQFMVFIRDHLGPLFEKNNLKGKIMLGTIQDGDYYNFPKKVLDDPRANGYVTYVGYQWGGLDCVAPTRRDFPSKNIMQTETECGNWNSKPGFNPDRPQNDWNYGVYTWNKVKDYFDGGVNSYLLWNMILDEEGKSIDSEKPWPQNAAIVVDKNTKQIIYTPMYYAFKHFSYYIKPGAHYIAIAGDNKNAIAFLNPDGDIIIQLQNDTQNANKIKIGIDKNIINITLPEMSWSTLVVPKLN